MVLLISLNQELSKHRSPKQKSKFCFIIFLKQDNSPFYHILVIEVYYIHFLDFLLSSIFKWLCSFLMFPDSTMSRTSEKGTSVPTHSTGAAYNKNELSRWMRVGLWNSVWDFSHLLFDGTGNWCLSFWSWNTFGAIVMTIRRILRRAKIKKRTSSMMLWV